MKRGLVLEGGAMRGLFTAGVIDVMMEAGIYPDGIVGVSAGAAFGCNYKSRQPGRVVRYVKRFANDTRFCGTSSLLRTGNIFNARFGYHTVPNYMDVFDNHTFEKNPMEFYAVVTDVETGTSRYRLCRTGGDEFYEWIRASSSMPLVSRIVRIGGMKFLDGGITDSIPLRFIENKGYDRNIVILTQPEGYVKHPNRALPLVRLAYRKYPNLVYAMAHRHEMYNRQTDYVSEAEKEGRILVIRPEAPLPIGHLSKDSEEIQRVYDLGRKAGEKYLDRIRKFWSTSHSPKVAEVPPSVGEQGINP